MNKLLLILASCFALPAFAEVAAVPGEYIVKMKPQFVHAMKVENIAKALHVNEAKLITAESQAFKIITTDKSEKREDVIARLQQNPMVQYAEPNFIYTIDKTPKDTEYAQLWGLKNIGQLDPKGIQGIPGIDIDAEKAWDITTGSKDVVVAVIDTGVDYTHRDLKNNIWTNTKEIPGNGIDDDHNGYIDDVHGYDFVNNDGDPMDDNMHGTHCSGTIGAQGDNDSDVVGVNWDVKIMGVKFLSGTGSGTTENAIKAVDYAVANGANILSNSWGGGGYSQALEESIQRAADKNIVFVAAAGNNSADTDAAPYYPQGYNAPNIISVASIDINGQLSYFSNYGATTVDVAAPGRNILSTVPKAISSSGMKVLSGTSMATPHVAGIAALVKAHEPNLTAAEVRERIMKTSRSFSALSGRIGSGIANAYGALTNTVPAPSEYDPGVWAKADYALSSLHPYAGGATASFTIHKDGAKKIAVHFSKFEVENEYDKVVFKDGSGKVIGEFSGFYTGSFSPSADGDTLIVELVADASVNMYGFDVDYIAYK